MTAFQAFESTDLPATDAGPYRELLRRPSMSLGVYRLAAGGTDHQHPHSSDEVYVVVSGRATLRVDGHDHPIGPGSIVSVDQGIEHGFADITEDLTVLVFFAPAEIPD
jgi:quercetin dioxygenase-like cupin family protein